MPRGAWGGQARRSADAAGLQTAEHNEERVMGLGPTTATLGNVSLYQLSYTRDSQVS